MVFEQVERGDIPIIRIGKRMAAFEKMLQVQSKHQIVAAELVRRLQQAAPEAT